MFESLTEKLGHAMRRLRGQDRLTEENMAEALQEIRTALLSADVHFKVAREFTEKVRATCVGREVLTSVTPGQMVVKVIHDELVELLGGGDPELAPAQPLKILLVGLHGSGKTTSTAKLGRLLTKRGLKPFLIAADVYRPAAIDQLETLGRQEGIPVFSDRSSKNVPDIVARGLAAATAAGATAILVDTAGRLQIDAPLIEEIKQVRARFAPDEVLLVADSALGQEAVNVARAFHEAVSLTGLVLTKLDGDARGGAALSLRAVTGVPIKFVGTGEKVGDFDLFHPDRMASRILGMGDVVSLVERAQEVMDEKEAGRLAARMVEAKFDLEDMLNQFRQMKKLGSLGGILEMLPGMGNVKIGDAEEKKMGRTEAIILSMTVKERRHPQILNGSRRLRIAKGSGTQLRDVNQLLKQYEQMKGMMRMMKGSKGRQMMKRMQSEMAANGGLPPGPRG